MERLDFQNKMGAYKCPQCGGGTGVVDSRPSGGGIRRRRKCYVCGHKTSTMEIPLETFHDLNVEERRTTAVKALNEFIEKFNLLNRGIKAGAKLYEDHR